MIDDNDPENTTPTKYLVWKKRKRKTHASHLCACTCDSNTRLEFHIEIRKIERGMAGIEMLRVLTTTTINSVVVVLVWLTCMSRFFCRVSWWVTYWAMQLLILWVSIVSLCLQSRGLSTLKFTFMGNDIFWSCDIFNTYRDVYVKYQMSPKIGTFEVYWISRRDRAGFSKLSGTCMYSINLLIVAQCFQFGHRPKKGIPCPFAAKTRYMLKIK